ncbi:MAG: hypothetical protein ACRD0G_10575 [Acidimicrobiales bacterium]
MHPAHLRHHGVTDLRSWCGQLHDGGDRIITLVRRNAARHALSALIMEAGGRPHHVGRGVETTPIHLEPSDVLRVLNFAEEEALEVRRAVGHRSHLALCYEDDLRDPACQQVTAERALRFLGLEPAPLCTDLVRRATPFEDQIENYAEIAELLGVTPYGDRLTEGT